jgi:GntR family transcriptional regulator
MFFELSFKSGKPTYLQIVEQVKLALATGALRSGEQLPSIRALAEQLRINRNTVSKAYGELEHEGIVALEQGRGVFCLDGGSPLADAERLRIMEQAVDGVIVQAYHLRVASEELTEILKGRLKAFEERAGRGEPSARHNLTTRGERGTDA